MSKRAAGLGLGERLEVEARVMDAFAPLRSQRATVGPTRVRAAVRWGRVDPQPPVPWAAAISRISELGVAVGMSAFVFAAAITSVPSVGTPILVDEAAIVEDVLTPRAPPKERWIVRVTPPADDHLSPLGYWLKQGRLVSYDVIDSTTPPRRPDVTAEPEVLEIQPLLALLRVR